MKTQQMKTLLLIDIQNDFLPGGSLAVADGDAIIPVVNKLQPHFELVAAAQDWHPAQHKSFASNHAGKKPFDVIELNGLKQTLWPDHCIQGTPGAEFSKQLQANRIEAIFRKGTNPEIDSYSGLYDNGHLRSTGMAAYLHDKKASSVYLAGLAGDICVFFSGMDCLAEGFETYIIEDAVRSISADDFSKNMEQFKAKGGKVIRSTEI
jgi:nicotinamidase/pyrazinamidase